MDPDVLDKCEKAGKLAAEALGYGARMIKEGVKILDVAQAVENFIYSKGGKLAFPVNLSMNNVAAHDTAIPNDERVFKDEVIKIDVGAQIDGYIGDNAMTVDLSGQNNELVRASRMALNNVSKMLQMGTTLNEIGTTIEETMNSMGFNPVRNLCGHGVAQYQQHTGYSIPNYANGDDSELYDGMTIAIEPFATTGEGLIREVGSASIFSLIAKRPVRNIMTRQVLKEIEKLNGLPFSARMIPLPQLKVSVALREMNNLGMLHLYPPLAEKKGVLISQAEHTFYISDKVKILTKI